VAVWRGSVRQVDSLTFEFYRPARQHPPPVLGAGVEVVVATPPARPSGPGAGWLAFLLPVAGSAGSAGMLLLLPVRRGGLLVAAVAAMVLLAAAAGLAPRLRERRARSRDRLRYLAYLERVRSRLDELAAAQRAAAELLHPDLPGLLPLVSRAARLWERRPGDDDFLTVRVGRGPVDLACPVRLAQAGPLADHDPELLAAAKELVAGAERLADVPVTLGLRDLGVVVVTGPPAPARALARAVICQLAAVHAPDDLRILASVGAGGAPAWDWLKWLPHTRLPAEAGPPTCLLATSPDRLAALLETEVRPRLDRLDRADGSPAAGPGGAGASRWSPRAPGERAQVGTAAPHLVVLLDGFSPQAPEGRLPLVGELLDRAAEAGATVLCLAAGRAHEPAELDVRLRLSDTGGLELEEAGPRGHRSGGITADDGSRLELSPDSLCLHGDTPGAVGMAHAVREALERAGVEIRSFA